MVHIVAGPDNAVEVYLSPKHSPHVSLVKPATRTQASALLRGNARADTQEAPLCPTVAEELPPLSVEEPHTLEQLLDQHTPAEPEDLLELEGPTDGELKEIEEETDEREIVAWGGSFPSDENPEKCMSIADATLAGYITTPGGADNVPRTEIPLPSESRPTSELIPQTSKSQKERSSGMNIFQWDALGRSRLPFIPSVTDDFQPTNAPPGSPEKIAEMRQRAEKGLPLWHEEDRCDYTGLTGAVQPRSEEEE